MVMRESEALDQRRRGLEAARPRQLLHRGREDEGSRRKGEEGERETRKEQETNAKEKRHDTKTARGRKDWGLTHCWRRGEVD